MHTVPVSLLLANDEANQQARAWCDKVNATFKKHLHARPRELFAVEQAALRPLDHLGLSAAVPSTAPARAPPADDPELAFADF